MSGMTLPRQSTTQARLLAMLASSAHFRDLPQHSRETLAGLARPVRFKAGQLVQSSNPPKARLWLVVSGAVRMSIASADHSVTTGVIGPGSFYSGGALVGSRETLTDAHAVSETELAVIDGEALVEAAARDPVLGKHLKTLLVRRLNALLLIFYDAMSAPLDKRLARRLMSQALAVGDRKLGEIEVRVSQSMLAEVLGASRSQVNATLQAFEEKGIVRRGYRRIYIANLAALCDIAGPNVQPI